MSLDGIFLNSIINDLYKKLIGGRVDKIYQPDKNEIVISIRSKGENYKLLITAISNSPRLHLTNVIRQNPSEPPMFCMLLRKHLTSAHITNIKQINFDRIVEISFECKDEFGTAVNKSLITEIMGKHSNIIFINEDKTIIDAIKRVAENISSVRQVYPGLKYVIPPGSDKLNPLTVTKDLFMKEIESTNNGIYIYNFLYKNFLGLSPFISREICYLTNLNESTYLGELSEEKKEEIWNVFSKIMNKIKQNDFSFNIFYDENMNQYGFYCLEVEYLKDYERKNFLSPGELLDEYYYELDNKNKINQRVASLIKNINTKIDRNRKKVEKQRNELLNAENRDKYKIYGELILANLHKTPENHKLRVINYYDPEQKEITIPLDPRFNLPQNSQKFFKRYNKLKKAEEELEKLIDITLNEIKYLENILFSIEECETIDDLNDIYSELISEGFMKRKSKADKSNKTKPITAFISSGGHEILVGKNNTQNDMITFKIAKNEDYWFHAKNMPGSHVIIRTKGDELTDEEFIEAAKIAAYYSKGKNSSTVEVDYTKKSNIKKPPNAKPGFVIYDTNYSMLVKPNIEGIKRDSGDVS
ncbi:MAG TPA: NFACT RNA binding domain-containing protein [Sedimentibacter sp.]|jgi:predicted ribosome quality control (RQC) complex YloA/Tae2 family protein|nr:NFACT family protein [Sedimentibacter sp.]NLA13477.1 fibronectin/fibrinogen-binding protein [Tissierellia bacterium]HAS92735.1 fibronectin/fibrinogen-binding protein [Clostridiales bacterium]HOA19661.1 NFACT RNA binding domain-containing protein [Sedimentibacter sp.]HOG62139.1 NFACT RNA binding domain-containing protein [Sedimentibacter sp.]